ncbi:MAG: ABC transporter permease [Candidatus Aminicenantes bacterium]|nr:ABC transporter permease [Acidobacteriota bacterium]MCG2810332.1 ABC transporter permease [Candidatus Aminicenantes bacterium]
MIMLNNLFRKTLRDQRLSLLGWSLGLVGLSLYLLYVYPFVNRAAAMMKVLDNLPPVIKNLIGKSNFMATPEGFFNLQPFSILAPLLFIVFAVAKGSDATAGEEERGTLDLLLANPLRRRQVVLQKSLAHGAALFVLSVVFWVGMAGGTWLFGIALNRLRLAAVIFSCWLLGLVFYSLSLACGCWRGKKKFSIGVSGGLAVITYLINAYAPMVENLRPYRIFSPFYFYNGNNVLSNSLHPVHVLVLAGLIAFFFSAALFAFSRRDLST